MKNINQFCALIQTNHGPKISPQQAQRYVNCIDPIQLEQESSLKFIVPSLPLGHLDLSQSWYSW